MTTALHRSSGRWQLGLFFSLLTVFLWGVLPIVLTILLRSLDVYTVIWFRFLVAFSLLFAYLSARKQLPPLAKLRILPWKLMGIAVIFLAINYFLFLKGLSQTSPANAQVIMQLSPVLLGLGALVIFKERYTPTQWTGLVVFGLGFVLYFWDRLRILVSASGSFLIGCGLLVLSAATWAIYALAQKQLLKALPSANVMLLLYGGCALIFWPFATPSKVFSLETLPATLLMFAALNTLVAYGAFAEALEHWEASRVSAVLTLTPLITLGTIAAFSVFLPHFLKSEDLTITSLTGAMFVVFGSLAIALGKPSQSLSVDN
jgi:drug/metabolite transporter (DMT)-like permease